jgi:alkylated DNA repair dioxygenase AlkB
METIIQTNCSSLILHNIDESICLLIERCIEKIDEELDVDPEIKMFGKICHQHRCVGFYSNTSAGYNYSTSITKSKKMNECLLELLDFINEKFNYDYNGILINKYIGGENYIGKHSDDIRGLDINIGVVALSYGEVRKFRIRNKKTGKIVVDIPTYSNKIIQMVGDFQKEFTHEIPVEKKLKGIRYSFTFRKHLT